MCMDRALAFQREQNTGVILRGEHKGKSFGEVIDAFMVGLDESGFNASEGNVRVIGDKGKRKRLDDSRVAVTAVRIGSARGHEGPTSFLLNGTKRRRGYTDEFLVKHGAAKGSSITMTDSAYTTDEAWLLMAPKLVRAPPPVSPHTHPSSPLRPPAPLLPWA